jgi:hypothetical protein
VQRFYLSAKPFVQIKTENSAIADGGIHVPKSFLNRMKNSKSMKGQPMKRKLIQQIYVTILILMTLLPTIVRAQINSGSTGCDGALDFSTIAYSTNIVIDMHDHPTGIYNYTYINIPSYVRVLFIPNANNTPVTWLVQSNCEIDGLVYLVGAAATATSGGAGGPGGAMGGSGATNPGQGPGGGVSSSYGGNASYGTLGDYSQDYSQGSPGAIYGNSFLIPLLGGSGGGAGTSFQYGGGGGGGAILIAASGIATISGGIVAEGGQGSGGGSGGAIRIVASEINGGGGIDTLGGIPINNGQERAGTGRVRFDTFDNNFGGEISGVFTQGFQPIIIPVAGQGVQLTIASVGGTSVSANPSGQPVTPDAIISGQQANPVPIVVNCLNVPLNTPVTVTVNPANGSPVSAIGYNTTGTSASSTATVSLNMPRGGGIIYATAATGN